jgi:hypothetical protein
MAEINAACLCYMCDQPSSTREHVPPCSFFPRSLRTNIWTVPSCEQHNLDNHLDVEYARNAISIQLGTNPTAEDIFEVAKRSWGYSPALFNRTFRGFGTVEVKGIKTGAFPIDLQRVEAVMNAVAHGLAYRAFGRGYIGAWRVLCATLRSRTPAPEWEKMRSMLAGATYERVAVPYPEVFSYGIHRTNPTGFIFRLLFYGGFVVYAWPVLNQSTENGEYGGTSGGGAAGVGLLV